jgi:hypothetical protein
MSAQEQCITSCSRIPLIRKNFWSGRSTTRACLNSRSFPQCTNAKPRWPPWLTSLGSHPVDHLAERIEIAVGIQESARLVMNAKLSPGPLLQDLFLKFQPLRVEQQIQSSPGRAFCRFHVRHPHRCDCSLRSNRRRHRSSSLVGVREELSCYLYSFILLDLFTRHLKYSILRRHSRIHRLAK